MSTRRITATLLLPVLLSSCTVRHTGVHQLVPGTQTQNRLTTPVKAHLLDGSTVVYASGVSFDSDTLRGIGWRFDVMLNAVGGSERMPLDSVAAMSEYRWDVDRTRTGKKRFYTMVLVLGSIAGMIVAYTSTPGW
jgi:hypothetical protein